MSINRTDWQTLVPSDDAVFYRNESGRNATSSKNNMTVFNKRCEILLNLFDYIQNEAPYKLLLFSDANVRGKNIFEKEREDPGSTYTNLREGIVWGQRVVIWVGCTMSYFLTWVVVTGFLLFTYLADCTFMVFELFWCFTSQEKCLWRIWFLKYHSLVCIRARFHMGFLATRQHFFLVFHDFSERWVPHLKHFIAKTSTSLSTAFFVQFNKYLFSPL